ncbi:mitochondrial uncoupling protein 5-like protein [Tanacetum coccineum]
MLEPADAMLQPVEPILKEVGLQMQKWEVRYGKVTPKMVMSLNCGDGVGPIEIKIIRQEINYEFRLTCVVFVTQQKELIQLRCEARLKYSLVRMTISGSEAATSSCTFFAVGTMVVFQDVLKPKQSSESSKVWEDVEDEPEPMWGAIGSHVNGVHLGKPVSPWISIPHLIANLTFKQEGSGDEIGPYLHKQTSRLSNKIVTASYLASYDHIKETILAKGVMKDGLGTHVTASFAAGFVAAISSNPMDVIKTRFMNIKVATGVEPQYKGAVNSAVNTVKA